MCDNGGLRHLPQTPGEIVCGTIGSNYPLSLLQSYYLGIKCLGTNSFPLTSCLHRRVFAGNKLFCLFHPFTQAGLTKGSGMTYLIGETGRKNGQSLEGT